MTFLCSKCWRKPCECKPKLVRELKRLADEPPAATFDSTEELMAYLDESKE